MTQTILLLAATKLVTFAVGAMSGTAAVHYPWGFLLVFGSGQLVLCLQSTVQVLVFALPSSAELRSRRESTLARAATAPRLAARTAHLHVRDTSTGRVAVELGAVSPEQRRRERWLRGSMYAGSKGAALPRSSTASAEPAVEVAGAAHAAAWQVQSTDSAKWQHNPIAAHQVANGCPATPPPPQPQPLGDDAREVASSSSHSAATLHSASQGEAEDASQPHKPLATQRLRDSLDRRSATARARGRHGAAPAGEPPGASAAAVVTAPASAAHLSPPQSRPTAQVPGSTGAVAPAGTAASSPAAVQQPVRRDGSGAPRAAANGGTNSDSEDSLRDSDDAASVDSQLTWDGEDGEEPLTG